MHNFQQNTLKNWLERLCISVNLEAAQQHQHTISLNHFVLHMNIQTKKQQYRNTKVDLKINMINYIYIIQNKYIKAKWQTFNYNVGYLNPE